MNYKIFSRGVLVKVRIPIIVLAVFFLLYFLYASNAINSEVAYSCNEKDECHEKILLLRGDILRNSTFRAGLALAWAKLTKTNTACMQLSGGVLSDALNIAWIINFLRMNICLALNYQLDNGHATKVSGICQSSCVWLIIGGRHRFLMNDRLLLGFHASRNRDGELVSSDLPSLKCKINSLLEKLKGSEKLKLLADWAFTQGHTSKTTNCSASELQYFYPYFTDLPTNMRSASDSTCGLSSSDEIRSLLGLHSARSFEPRSIKEPSTDTVTDGQPN